MQPADRWAFRGIRDLVIDIMTTNKTNVADIEIHDMGAFYTLQVKTRILKTAGEVTAETTSDDQENASS